MKRMLKAYILAFVLIITLAGVSYADDVTIQLGSGDGFKVLDSNGSPLMDILSNGKVGIGTSPNYKLDVSGDINFTGSLYQNGSAFSGSAWTTSNSDIYYNDGNLGIGTTSPDRSLDVEGNGMVIIGTGSYSELMLRGQVSNIPSSIGAWHWSVRGDVGGDNDNLKLLRFNSGNYQGLSLVVDNSNGYVGIGTTSPSEKLEVAGNIKVIGGSFIDDGATLVAPDYVFEEGYELMPLADLQAYIEKEKHLPNVPSAETIKEEGLNISQFQMKLLEKVEELTLHAISREVENKALEEQNKTLEDRLTKLEAVISQM